MYENVPNIFESETNNELQSIAEGNGFEVIERIGWAEYRRLLAQVPYSEMIGHKINQIQTLQELTQPLIDKDELRRRNFEAAQKIPNIIKFFEQEHGQRVLSNNSNPYYAFSTDKKLTIRSRKNDPTNIQFLRRIYHAVPTASVPQVFHTMFEAMVDNGAMGAGMDLVLNRENFPEDVSASDYEASFNTNTIISYVYEDDPELMQKVVKAALEVQSAHPEYYELPPQEEINLKTAHIRDFLIPLDDRTAFAEMTDTSSYHSGVVTPIYFELFGWDFPSLEVFHERMQKYSSEQPGEFSSEYSTLKRRKMYQPALISS